jgi:hypothetical protein
MYQKDAINNTKRQPTDWKKLVNQSYIVMCHLTMGTYSEKCVIMIFYRRTNVIVYSKSGHTAFYAPQLCYELWD